MCVKRQIEVALILLSTSASRSLRVISGLFRIVLYTRSLSSSESLYLAPERDRDILLRRFLSIVKIYEIVERGISGKRYFWICRAPHLSVNLSLYIYSRVPVSSSLPCGLLVDCQRGVERSVIKKKKKGNRALYLQILTRFHICYVYGR